MSDEFRNARDNLRRVRAEMVDACKTDLARYAAELTPILDALDRVAPSACPHATFHSDCESCKSGGVVGAASQTPSALARAHAEGLEAAAREVARGRGPWSRNAAARIRSLIPAAPEVPPGKNS